MYDKIHYNKKKKKERLQDTCLKLQNYKTKAKHAWNYKNLPSLTQTDMQIIKVRGYNVN